jgi:hypothetical protein
MANPVHESLDYLHADHSYIFMHMAIQSVILHAGSQVNLNSS